MRPIDADALFEVIKKSMAENPHKEETQRAMHIHEHKYFLTLLTSFPTIQPEERTEKRTETHGVCLDAISRQAAIDALDCINGVEEVLRSLPSAQPNRELIDDYMWKIKQNISPHTAADGVIAIKYYLEQIYEQIYGKGEKPKWMI